MVPAIELREVEIPAIQEMESLAAPLPFAWPSPLLSEELPVLSKKSLAKVSTLPVPLLHLHLEALLEAPRHSPAQSQRNATSCWPGWKPDKMNFDILTSMATRWLQKDPLEHHRTGYRDQPQ
ncbi:unnamed protein product [Durusdinium trenchii]|uniref:Uncharacterized protein n=1 Tax=Durusdinium trenchii TaxID=1381693 RepID=A0ABP0PYN3_9DINO